MLEISRLNNSLQHLHATQEILREHIAGETPGQVDVEITTAIEENTVTMWAQFPLQIDLKFSRIYVAAHRPSGSQSSRWR
jgi:hypothetical protein